MIDKTVIAQIIKLRAQHQSKKSIARITGVSRTTVDKYLANPNLVGHKPGPPSYFEPYRDLIRECLLQCKGNCAKASKLFKEKLEDKPFQFKERTFRKFCSQWRDSIAGIKKAERVDVADRVAYDTKGLSKEELIKLVSKLKRKLRTEKRRANCESAKVQALKELIVTAEKDYKIDILKSRSKK